MKTPPSLRTPSARQPAIIQLYDHRNAAQQQRLLETAFAGHGWQVPRLLQGMRDAPDFYFDSVSQVRMDSWSAGRSVLIGDAGQCPSPLSGQGTSIAMVGAYVLAESMRTVNGEHDAALASYEHRMRDFAATRLGSWCLAAGRLGVVLAVQCPVSEPGDDLDCLVSGRL
jgi:2-polyprenyl-6-methoxyphenol hydroxylase-like FAD-dependent oxidoreductase